jgi:hypothetical protein
LDNKRKQKTKEMDVQGLLGAQTGQREQVDEDRLRCFACGQFHPGRRLLRLPDGTTVGNYSEEYRLYAEAKSVLKRFRTRKTRQLHLARVAELRGQSGYNALRNAMLKIYNRENKE